MKHVALAMLAVLLGGCLSGAVAAAIRDWFREDDRRCADWCALDVDAECGGEARDLSTCVSTCRATEDGACADEHTVLHACEADLTCDEYRQRGAKGGRCETRRAAADTCASQL